MAQKRWNNREIDQALQRLGATYELSPERSAVLEARVRREVIARYGRFDVSMYTERMAHGWQTDGARITDVHTENSVGRGMLISLGLRPAFVLAGIGALLVGAVIAVERIGFKGSVLRAPAIDAPQIVSTDVVAAAPIEPGSGAGVSVFAMGVIHAERAQAGAASETQTASPASPPATQRAWRAGARRLNPAAGVFSQWGEGVFSDEEVMRSGQQQRGVFNS